jgi:hypothetical protein
MRVRLVPALALTCLGAGALLATAAEPVLYVADFHVKPAKDKEFLDLVKKYDQPMFDKLMAAGAVLAWGIDTPLLHDPSGASHHFWWVCPDMASLEKVLAAEDELDKRIDAEDEKAAKEAMAAGKPAPKKTLERLFEAIDLAKHRDRLFSQQVGDTRPAPAGSQPFIFVTFTKAQPGKGADLRAAWEKYIKPTLDTLLADGTVISYGFSVAAPRTEESTNMSWATLPNLAARDKYNAAFDARSEADRKEATAAFVATLDASATRGMILRSLIFKSAAPGK